MFVYSFYVLDLPKIQNILTILDPVRDKGKKDKFTDFFRSLYIKLCFFM